LNLRQLRYIAEIARQDFNISTVAGALHTSQSGISKQVKLLENELGIEIFVRSRSRLSGVTAEGERVIEFARRALEEIANIHAVSRDLARPNSGTINIATSHTQARYVLSGIMKRFAARYPKVRIRMRLGDPQQIAELVLSGQADIGVTTVTADGSKELMSLPYRSFERIVIVPHGHGLLRTKRITLKALARYPLIAYEPQFTGRRALVKAFEKEGLIPGIFVSAIDADVIKTCVEQGLGIAVVSEVTFDAKRDAALRAIRAGHLFEPSSTHLLLHRRRYLQQHAYDFIEMWVPTWTKSYVQRTAASILTKA
jgi:LysR family cys regulon transcriptional activator